jgi:sirohydrochlorin cobaltochelatase
MGLDELRDLGVDEILAVPGMLFAATHARNDIPSVLTSYQEKHSNIKIKYGRELALHPEMITAFQARILEALKVDSIQEGELYDTMLVVVGRGTSDVSANAEAAKLTRIVAENMGFGWSETVYSGVTFPSVGQGLNIVTGLGYKKIVVAPYFLFTGRLIDRIYKYVDIAAKQFPNIEFLKAKYLADQDHVINTFVDRISEAENGIFNDDKDLMLSFQERLASGKIEIHHHHAEYQPITDPEDDDVINSEGHSHDHSHSHDHTHSHEHHHHGVYRHIAHPNGPRTMIDEGVCCCFMSQFPQDVIDDERQKRAKALSAPEMY